MSPTNPFPLLSSSKPDWSEAVEMLTLASASGACVPSLPMEIAHRQVVSNFFRASAESSGWRRTTVVSTCWTSGVGGSSGVQQLFPILARAFI